MSCCRRLSFLASNWALMAYKLVQMAGFMWLLYEVASLNQFCSLQPVKSEMVNREFKCVPVPELGWDGEGEGRLEVSFHREAWSIRGEIIICMLLCYFQLFQLIYARSRGEVPTPNYVGLSFFLFSGEYTVDKEEVAASAGIYFLNLDVSSRWPAEWEARGHEQHEKLGAASAVLSAVALHDFLAVLFTHYHEAF